MIAEAGLAASCDWVAATPEMPSETEATRPRGQHSSETRALRYARGCRHRERGGAVAPLLPRRLARAGFGWRQEFLISIEPDIGTEHAQ